MQPAWTRVTSSESFGGRLRSWLRRAVAVSEEAADLMIALVTPASVVAGTLGLWRLAADLDWTETFPISNGFFSHWQVWIAIAIGLKTGAYFLTSKTGHNGKTSEEN